MVKKVENEQFLDVPDIFDRRKVLSQNTQSLRSIF
jgi:hypothetical protein